MKAAVSEKASAQLEPGRSRSAAGETGSQGSWEQGNWDHRPCCWGKLGVGMAGCYPPLMGSWQ